MPHATEEIVNGESGSSKLISHLTSYPAVSDGIDTFKSNPYGKKSLEIVDNAYARFGKPFEPYVEKPYSYAKPYVSKADELGDQALSRVDGHFPIVKEKTGTIVEKTKSTVFWPYTYLNNTWSDEYTKTANHNNRGNGIATSVLAIVSLELRVASDFFHFVADNLSPAYEQGKSRASDMASDAMDKASEYERYGKEKYSQLKGEASKKYDEAADTASKTADNASKKTNEAADTASKKYDEAKNTASQKTDEAKNTASKKTDEAKSQAQQTKDKVQK